MGFNTLFESKKNTGERTIKRTIAKIPLTRVKRDIVLFFHRNMNISPETGQVSGGWSNEAKFPSTRKSSCVNARGISSTPVLHLLSCTRWGTPPSRVPPHQVWWGGVPKVRYTPRWGTSQPGLMGVPEVGYPLSRVPPSQVWRGVPVGPGWGTPPGVNILKTLPSLELRTRSVITIGNNFTHTVREFVVSVCLLRQ